MTETLRPLKAMPATQGFRFVEPTTAFDQRHLGRKVITLKHLDGLRTAAEAHVVSAAVVAASQEPAGVHTQPPSLKQSGDPNGLTWVGAQDLMRN